MDISYSKNGNFEVVPGYMGPPICNPIYHETDGTPLWTAEQLLAFTEDSIRLTREYIQFKVCDEQTSIDTRLPEEPFADMPPTDYLGGIWSSRPLYHLATCVKFAKSHTDRLANIYSAILNEQAQEEEPTVAKLRVITSKVTALLDLSHSVIEAMNPDNELSIGFLARTQLRASKMAAQLGLEIVGTKITNMEVSERVTAHFLTGTLNQMMLGCRGRTRLFYIVDKELLSSGDLKPSSLESTLWSSMERSLLTAAAHLKVGTRDLILKAGTEAPSSPIQINMNELADIFSSRIDPAHRAFVPAEEVGSDINLFDMHAINAHMDIVERRLTALVLGVGVEVPQSRRAGRPDMLPPPRPAYRHFFAETDVIEFVQQNMVRLFVFLSRL